MRQKQIPHLKARPAFAQGVRQLRQHGPRPGPRAQLLQAALVNVDEGDALGGRKRGLDTRQRVLQVLVHDLQHVRLRQQTRAQADGCQPCRKKKKPSAARTPFKKGHLAFQRVMPWYCAAPLSILNK